MIRLIVAGVFGAFFWFVLLVLSPPAIASLRGDRARYALLDPLGGAIAKAASSC